MQTIVVITDEGNSSKNGNQPFCGSDGFWNTHGITKLAPLKIWLKTFKN